MWFERWNSPILVHFTLSRAALGLWTKTDMLLPGRPQAPRHDPISGSMVLFHIVKSSTETRS